MKSNTCYIPVMSHRWLMLLYSLPARPSTQRVYVWRRLKSFGALYLQNSACLLPDKPEHRRWLGELKQEIEARKGEARLMPVRMEDEEKELVASFRRQSDEDYQELLGRCRDFHAELEEERAACHFNFAELEENEVELDKLRAWLPKIQARDFFEAALAPKAISAIKACEKDFAKYGKEVAKVEGVHETASPPMQRQRTDRERGKR